MGLFQIFSGLLLLVGSSAQPQEIRTGIVPIFQPRNTQQPITFTFTTPSPNKRIATEFPVNVEPNKFPTLRPERPENYNVQNAPWAPSGPVGSISPIIEVPSIDLSVPIYNQAQYFRALQKAGAMSYSGSQEVVPVVQPKIIPVSTGNSKPTPATSAPVVSPKIVKVNSVMQNLQADTFWRDLEDAWTRTKVRLNDTGAMSDWRRLWEKLTGVLEPFFMDVGERLGRAVNRAMRQQAGAASWKSEENK